MSQRWDQVEERLDDYESQLDSVYRLYHIPVLAALMLFMLWIRVRHYGRMIGEGGEPLYRGNDPYYHRRTTDYVIQNYPFNMPYEVWSGFDTGTQVGQFGTIFDQIVATVALVVGLGSPSQSTVTLVTVLTPPVIAVLCVPPMYYVGKRLGGRLGGIIGVLVLALTPGQFLSRSVAGVYDHHIAEVLATLLVLSIGMTMLTVAQREKPIYEFVETRELGLLKEPVAWGAALGVALTLTMLVWPPAVFLLGIYAIFLFFHLSVEFVRGHSPDHVVIPSVVAALVAAVLLLPFLTAFSLETTELSLLQPLLAVLVAGGALFMAAVARLWENRDLPRNAYPIGVAGIGAIAAAVLAVVAPDTFGFLLRQVERVAGLGSTDTAATVGEAQALDNPVQFFFTSYGLAFYTAMIGVLVVAVRAVFAQRPRAEQLLVATFTALMVIFTMTQLRFDYYLAIGVAAGNAYLVGQVFSFIDLDDVRADVTKVEPYQVLIVVAILFVVAGPLVATAAPMRASDSATNPGEYEDWQGSLEWLSEETPDVGEYGGSGPRDLAYYGSYGPTDDFEYTDGEYGVMAWWDYGHYITYGGERIPVANPFQQHADQAADFLLAGNETEANDILAEDSGEGEGTRYVMVDYQLGYAGTTKYNAPTAFETRHGLNTSDLGLSVASPRALQRGQYVPLWGIHTQRAYESMRVRLYQFHGSAREPASFVSRFRRGPGGIPVPPEDGAPIQQFDSPEQAREAAQSDPTAIHGGLLGQPGERVGALEHYRLVHASEQARPSPLYSNLRVQDPPVESEVKTFERVEGATIEGTGPANTEVEASVTMEIPTTDQTFTYRQFARTDDQGNFEMTVPYSTTGYDEYGTEAGYTNVSVRANSSYRFLALADNGSRIFVGGADVTEGQVLGENDTVTQVELQEQTTSDNETAGDETTNDATNGTATSGNETSSDAGGGTNATATATPQQQRGVRAS
ncbi:oligosaccharyl transferase, archaeosortase A system-associated [Natronomonas marina]|jgi:oligosaccharyl transferase (archaeosortase A-associated)|uniref:oligosaccharyl transferase, archaeosortase A system-associated n=1 Tax=Natronomonas marina TaxID=2961939 RepID=UPI0020CA0E3C|nr:oligosaccharyl transferase, archaeosortase A system-associated [Natronomonas marina]